MRPKRNRPALILVAEEADREKSIVDVLKGEARTGIPGVAFSLVVHGLLLTVLALIVISIQRESEAPLAFGWIAPTRTQQNTIIKAPVQIQAISPITKPIEKPQPKPLPREGEKVTRPVKPVDVSRSLKVRLKRGSQGRVEGDGTRDSVRQAIDSGLGWLGRQQKSAGNWQLHQGYPDAGDRRVRTDTGATALALLAYLGDGHTHLTGDHKEAVARGLRWLKGIQKPDGNYHDHTELGRPSAYYAHSMATIAICEAYAMTGDDSLRKSADMAIQFLLDSQQPKAGGWKYMPQDDDSMGDLSVSGWGLMAMHTARMAGIDVPDKDFGLASQFVDACQTRGGALYRYEPSDPVGKVSAAMTASGLLIRQWLGWPKDDIALTEGVEWLMQEKFAPGWKNGSRNVYAWYYTAQVLHNLGGDRFTNWFDNVQTEIINNQKRRGSRKSPTDVVGSWGWKSFPGSAAEHSNFGGRLYMTSLCLLILETPTRHAPIYVDDDSDGENERAATSDADTQ